MLPLFVCLCLTVEFGALTLCLTPAILLDPCRTLTLSPDSPSTISHRTVGLPDWRMASQKFIRPMDQRTGTLASSRISTALSARILFVINRTNGTPLTRGTWNASSLDGVTPRWFFESLWTQSFASHSLHVTCRTFGELAESVEADAKDLGNWTSRYEPNR